jgi:hypothetical protein
MKYFYDEGSFLPRSGSVQRIRIDCVRNEPQSYPVVEQARHHLRIPCLYIRKYLFCGLRAGSGSSRIVFFKGARMH